MSALRFREVFQPEHFYSASVFSNLLERPESELITIVFSLKLIASLHFSEKNIPFIILLLYYSFPAATEV
jgi:hypothetical protein